MTITRVPIRATDGTLRNEKGRNTQSQLFRVTGSDLNPAGMAFIAEHDLDFDPTWVQVETVSLGGAQSPGTIVPVVNDFGGTNLSLAYNHQASPLPDGIYLRFDPVPGTTPTQLDFIMHCGRTHSKAL